MGVVPNLAVVMRTDARVTKSNSSPKAKYPASTSKKITSTVRPKNGGLRAKNPALKNIEYAAAASNSNCRETKWHRWFERSSGVDREETLEFYPSWFNNQNFVGV